MAPDELKTPLAVMKKRLFFVILHKIRILKHNRQILASVFQHILSPDVQSVEYK